MWLLTPNQFCANHDSEYVRRIVWLSTPLQLFMCKSLSERANALVDCSFLPAFPLKLPVLHTYQTQCAKFTVWISMLCAKTSVQNSSLTGVQNTKGRSIVKCMAFAGASTLCANLTSVQIIEVCKLTGLTVFSQIEIEFRNSVI